MIAPLRAVLKIILLILWSIPLVITQVIVLLFHKGPGAYFVPQFWHRGVSFIIGLKTEVDGVPPTTEQVIFVSNHLSYLDIFAIGSTLRASFIAKEEIANWPVIGFLSKVQQTAFISRSSNQAKNVANSLANMLKEGKSLILFPEGTSTSGHAMLAFKSSLFSLAWQPDGSALPVQPFTLKLLKLEGKTPDPSPTGHDLYSWYADMDFAPHFWDFLCARGATVRLTFHPVIQPAPEHDRKILAQLAFQAVNAGLTSNP